MNTKRLEQIAEEITHFNHRWNKAEQAVVNRMACRIKILEAALRPFADAWNTTVEEEESPHDAIDYVSMDDFETAAAVLADGAVGG